MRPMHWLAGIVLLLAVVSLSMYLAQPEIDGLISHFRNGSGARYAGLEIKVPLTDEFTADNLGIDVSLGGGRLNSWVHGDSFGNMLIHRNSDAHRIWSVEGVRAMQQRLGSKEVAEVNLDAAGFHYQCIESENHTIVDIWCIVPDSQAPFVHFFGMRRSVAEFYGILRSAVPSPTS